MSGNDNLQKQTTKSDDWHAGFAAARHQAACEMGHYIVDDWDREDIAEAVYERIKEIVWNPECREHP